MTPDVLAKGKELYEGKGTCANCHGQSGEGDGAGGLLPTPGPRNFTNCKFHKKRNDGELFWVVKNREYTSARLKTQGRLSWTYGRVEARIKVAGTQGLWAAFWVLGNNITSVGWPDCGEIDIMESIGKEPSRVHGVIHGPGYSGGSNVGGTYSLPGGVRFPDGFHLFAVGSGSPR